MKISACVIVKNEEKNIRRCIESFQKYADEIIVVDTGSGDDTVKIAEELGAKVYYFSWVDDFAAAKNFALEKAVGEWVIFPDADEFFYNGTAKNIRRLIYTINKDPKINGIMCKIYNTDNFGGRIIVAATCLRVFRNIKSIRFKGNIHEKLTDNGDNVYSIYADENDLTIYHTGYNVDQIESKSRRNLNLLIDNLKKDPVDPLTYIYLSDCYIVLNEHEKAIKYAKMFIESGKVVFGNECQPYRNIILAMLKMNIKTEDNIIEIDNAISRFPYHPEFYRYKAVVLKNQKKYDKALQCFFQAIQLQQNYKSPEPNGMMFVMGDVYFNIGLIYACKNLDSEALKYFILSLKLNKYEKNYLREFIKLISKEEYTDIILVLRSIYDENNEKDIEFIVSELSISKAGKLLMYYYGIWKNRFKHDDIRAISVLLANGFYDKAFLHFHEAYQIEKDSDMLLMAVVAALLSGKYEDAKVLESEVELSMGRILKAYFNTGENIQLLIDEDLETYKKLLAEFLLLANEEKMGKFLMVSFQFEKDISLVIADVLFNNRNYKHALQMYEHAIECDYAEKGLTHTKIGFCYYKLLQYDAAIEEFTKADEYGYKENDIYEFVNWVYEQCSNEEIKARALKVKKEIHN